MEYNQNIIDKICDTLVKAGRHSLVIRKRLTLWQLIKKLMRMQSGCYRRYFRMRKLLKKLIVHYVMYGNSSYIDRDRS